MVDRGTALEWIVRGGAGLAIQPAGDPDDEVRLPALVGFVELDAQRVGPGEQPLDDGAWDVQIRWSGLGLQSTGLLRLPRRARSTQRPAISPALLGRPMRWVVPTADTDGVLRVLIGGADRAPARIDDAARRVLRQGGGLALELPIATDRAGALGPGVLRLRDHGRVFDLPAAIEGSLGLLVVAGSRERSRPSPAGGTS